MVMTASAEAPAFWVTLATGGFLAADDWPDEAVRGLGAVAGFCDSAVAPIRARARTTRVRIILKYTFPFDDKGLEVCKSLYDMQFAKTETIKAWPLPR